MKNDTCEIISTPICDFVKDYSDKRNSRLHMPGHKGKSYLGFESLDITEIDGADSLYTASGIIRESELNASRLFGTKETVYSTEGSSQCIGAMLFLACLSNKKMSKPTIIAARNVHKSFIKAAGLLDFDIKWLLPESREYSLCECKVSVAQLRKVLAETANPVAVYITSPDYLGNIADIKAVSEVAHEFGALLLVDNAHGSYLKFLEHSMHPIDLGADICCDSAHKTLPVLTGGAYLHFAKSAPNYRLLDIRHAMELFGSTSPSYLILQSLDLANRYISENYNEKLNNCISRIVKLKSVLTDAGWDFCSGQDLLKVTINTSSRGYTGKEIADILYKSGIVCEYADPDYVVMMFSPDNDDDDYIKVFEALKNLQDRDKQIKGEFFEFELPKSILSVRDAIFASSETISTVDSCGRIMSSLCVSCPPAISPIISGEIITENAINILLYYGIKQVNVIKNN